MMAALRRVRTGISRRQVVQNAGGLFRIGATVVAKAKWFNPAMGFGFLTPVDGSREVFYHVSVLSWAGYDTLPEGATVTCEVEQSRQRLQVSQIHAVDASTATTRPTGSGAPPRGGHGHLHGEGVFVGVVSIGALPGWGTFRSSQEDCVGPPVPCRVLPEEPLIERRH